MKFTEKARNQRVFLL